MYHKGENLLLGKAERVLYCVGYDLLKILHDPQLHCTLVTSRVLLAFVLPCSRVADARVGMCEKDRHHQL